MCLDRVVDLDFFWKPLPNECCQSASSSGFAVPTTGMMLEMLCAQFGDDATMIWAWFIQGICFCWRVICVYVPWTELLFFGFLWTPLPNECCQFSFIRWISSAYDWNVRKVVWAIGRMLEGLWAWVMCGILGAEMLWR